ncbi:MAG TPA: polysaccharide deacetylase family protein [Ferruginibacter sp.]|nr:polysaccharide deacetylase family protein [Ferruginibacter sp.]
MSGLICFLICGWCHTNRGRAPWPVSPPAMLTNVGLLHCGGTYLFCDAMVLIYSHISSPRLQYTCSFIFKELMGIEFSVTIDSEEFKSHEGPKINYSKTAITPVEFCINNHSLLFETGIKEQSIECFETNKYKAFFKTETGNFPFDVFAASFYLISRYEEYLSHEKDSYGRYAHKNSLAFKVGFLHLPIINTWVADLAATLNQHFFHGVMGTIFNSPYSIFSFKPTYDIDIAYSYKHKGLLRNIGGFLKSPSAERLQVLAASKKDPFDIYEWLDGLHQRYNLKPFYFFLVAEKNSRYDKNILPHKEVMWKLVKQHAKKYAIGLHPSWQSGDEPGLLKKELEQLTAMVQEAGSVPTLSRQHYIRFNLPDGYRRLSEAGITDDYSMGYGSINGFRASVASSFFWYDLIKEQQAALRIHPFCYMDANSFYEQKLNTQQAYDELMHYYQVCKEADGTLISIWHNNFLGTGPAFKGWKEMYEKFIALVQQ